MNSYEIITINLCIARIRLTLATCLGLGAFVRIDRSMSLAVFVGPFVLEVGRL